MISAVLITREKEYPPEVLHSLPKFFDEVVIERECPTVLRRYELASKAVNDVIYIQDDDCVTDIESLYKRYNGQITNALSDHHRRWYSGSGITLVGYGTFFPKKMIDFTKYTDLYGLDELLLSQADRVFTYLNQPHNPVSVRIDNLPRATESGRMSTSSDHWDNLEKIKKRLYAIP